MFIHKAIAALALGALMSAAAYAAPVLRAEVNVASQVVTVGDMFDDAGILAEAPLFRAPRPGTAGMVPLDAIKAAAARIGLESFDTAGVVNVRVMRKASVVDEQKLTQLIAANLKAKGILTTGMTAQTIFSQPITPINAEVVGTPVTLVNLRYLPENGAFTAQFLISGIAVPLNVTGTIDLMIPAPHLAANLAAGTILSKQDIIMRPVPLKYAESTGFASLDQLVGKQLQRQSREGMLLKPADVAIAQLIARNQFVTIYFRKGPMTLTVKGQALGSAAPGEPVQVLNLMSNRVVSATATAPGAVEIASAPTNLAQL
ncbi:flagellar basal body P-ring formation chaperone FlgA [Devosia rhodophyticola]|uniref:Flagellar basal body P-ring formation chaperone FlgA n=1 Tax=Devosia rhodophyticola TaxID=3026423 RepID=A0ABY7YW59_9HYPH|nr:flagellar basal body P-ring formation chaperone FlgA [Devosia rhodophyticola]WDR05422.1 flagellar basal body P-ring formation chaperone FlgA [Devosia rhodophyticola]